MESRSPHIFCSSKGSSLTARISSSNRFASRRYEVRRFRRPFFIPERKSKCPTAHLRVLDPADALIDDRKQTDAA